MFKSELVTPIPTFIRHITVYNFSIFIFSRTQTSVMFFRTVGIMNDFIVIVQSVPLGGVYKTLPPSPAPYATPYRDNLDPTL